MITDRQRFNSKFRRSKNNSCWVWMAAKDDDGYGKFRLGREQFAHRAQWILTNGPIPKGKCVCHTCDNPPCVNPSHLFIGTQIQNIKDRELKNRGGAAPGSKNGSVTMPAGFRAGPEMACLNSLKKRSLI